MLKAQNLDPRQGSPDWVPRQGSPSTFNRGITLERDRKDMANGACKTVLSTSKNNT